MITIENLTNTIISNELLDKIACYLTDKDIELVVCDDDFMKTLNTKYRQKNITTDVLSFPISGNIENMPLGSIVISMDKVVTQADEFNHSKDDELALLFLHGLLHLLDYDHEKDNGEMRKIEEKLIRHFDLPPSLIVRSGDNK